MRSIARAAVLFLSCPSTLVLLHAQARQPLDVATPSVRCAGLARVTLDAANVTAADFVAAAAAIPGAQVRAGLAAAMPAFCRVRITDRPTPDSEIRSEVWLPASGWNGKFRGTGNGGFAGELYYSDMAEAVEDGYATAGTDTGHTGGEASFALGHPEKVKDFGWRGIHDMTVEAKIIAATYYGKAPSHSYFAGCSDGGREALMEAQRFPADYDGILAGAPAYHWTALVASGTLDTQAMLASTASYIPASKIPTIAAAVRAQCDALDGLSDGVINDPRACRFDPAALACKAADAADCLTPEQIATLKAIYAPKLDSSGKEIYPGLLPGAEEGPGGWTLWIAGRAPGFSLTAFFGRGYFGNFVYGKPDWTIKSFDFNRDLTLADEKTAQALNATDTDLRPFAARGGKLILYHGWNDPAIPALGTVEYYDAAGARLGRQAADSTVRLYMVPGMQHCGGGAGATSFGQSGETKRGDAQHDIFTALEEWVETGKTPGAITARGESMTRPLCPYPAAAKYLGGDPAKADSFECKGR